MNTIAMSRTVSVQKNKNQSSMKKYKLKKYIPLYIMLIPFVAYFLIFCYKPMGGLVIAFQNYSVFKGITGSEWVGLENFKNFLSTPYFGRVLKNTIVLNLWALAFSFPAPIIFAILLNEVRIKKLQKAIQTLTYMPYFISTVVIAGIVINLLSPSYGIITLIVEKFCGEKIYFLSKPQYFRPIYTIMNIWQGLGYNAVIYIAAITGIDVQLYEAASIDGANKFRQIIHVTLPGILPTIMIMLIMRVGNMLASATDTVLLLYQPATYEVSDVIGTYVYRTGLLDANYSLATAVSLFNSIIALLLVGGANYISKKVTEVGLW